MKVFEKERKNLVRESMVFILIVVSFIIYAASQF